MVAFLRMHLIAEAPARLEQRLAFGHPLCPQPFRFELDVRPDLLIEIRLRATPPSVHGVTCPLDQAESFGSEDEADGSDERPPLRGLTGELLTTGGGELVEARLPVGGRHPPLRADPPSRLEALQRRVEGAVVDDERIG